MKNLSIKFKIAISMLFVGIFLIVFKNTASAADLYYSTFSSYTMSDYDYDSYPFSIGRTIYYDGAYYTLDDVNTYDEGTDYKGKAYRSYEFIYKANNVTVQTTNVLSSYVKKNYPADGASITKSYGEEGYSGHGGSVEVSVGTGVTIPFVASQKFAIDACLSHDHNTTTGQETSISYTTTKNAPLGSYTISETVYLQKYLVINYVPVFKKYNFWNVDTWFGRKNLNGYAKDNDGKGTKMEVVFDKVYKLTKVLLPTC